MSLSGSPEIAADESEHRRVRTPQPLLDTTLDQLRTLVVVHQEGTALAAARLLGREQSSVQKQLDTLNRNFRDLCGEPLVLKQGRGKSALFTETGEALVERARDTLDDWLEAVTDSRRRVGGSLRVGTTRFTLGFLTPAVERVSADFRTEGVDLKVVHLRTRNLLEALRANEVDLVCGSTLTDVGSAPPGLDVLEWRRSGLTLVTNLDRRLVPGSAVRAAALPRLPLVVAGSGLVAEFLRGWFGADYRGALNLVAEVDDVRYGFELLSSGLVHGCMLVTRGVAEAAVDGRLPDGRGLRALDVLGDLEPKLEVLVGAFARAGELRRHDAGHPLNRLWEALQRQHSEWRERSPDRSTAGG
ncbi:LysR substrate-binding domain-containing protein [Saccharopolyspora sp. MS10]|uniref:LysR substrate-binding domain-containing protein n=1 Tax=Saccharopolyspora sp. MS10 TaxID=3385973 RepID=UPI0039A26A61